MLSGQLEDAKAAAEYLQAARALLDALVHAGPFSELQLVDWMGLPNLEAAMGDHVAAEGDQKAAHEWYEKALALQTQLVARRPGAKPEEQKPEETHIPKAKTRKEVLEEIEARLKENAPKQPPKQPSKTRKP